LHLRHPCESVPRVLALPLALLLTAAPLKVAAPGLSCESVAPAVCAAYTERFASLLSGEGLEVLTASAVASMLGFERQRQLLGCTDSQCELELAGALDVDGLLTGSLVKTPVAWLATLKVVRVRDGSAWVQATARLSNEEELERFLDATAAQFREQLSPRHPAPGRSALVRWVPAMVGGAALVSGGALYASSKADAAALRDVGAPLGEAEVKARAAAGSTKEKLGLTLAGVGLAAIAASILWATLAPPVSVAVAPVSGGGGAVVVGGAW
jgi:hypothetical protein